MLKYKNIYSLEVFEKKLLINAFLITAEPRVSVDENGIVMIHDYNAISEDEYEAISRYMNRLGYDWRGAEDAKELMTRYVYMVKGYDDDMAKAIIDVLGLDFQFEEEEGLNAEDIFEKAKEEFPLTDNASLAGYLLPDGSMLDFSGGQGQRIFDHRDISSIDDALGDLSDGMIQFMHLGAIRLHASDMLYIDISDANFPTPEQNSVLRDSLTDFNGNSMIQISGPTGSEIDSREYENADPQMIVNEIGFAIKNGEFPQSRSMRFR